MSTLKYARSLVKRLACCSHVATYPSSMLTTQGMKSLATIQRRTQMGMQESQEINMIPESVAFNAIDKYGRTRRFYRQVFINELTSSHPHFNDQTQITTMNTLNLTEKDGNNDIKSESRWAIFLDNRLLMCNERAILLDSYKLALIIASEFESQSEYMRCESMPITETIVSYFENIQESMLMHKQNELKYGLKDSVYYDDVHRRSFRGSVVSHFENDLLKICENEELYNKGYYNKYWLPIIEWFNKEFESNIRMECLFMYEEEAPLSEYKKLKDDFSGLLELDSTSLINNFKRTDISSKIDYFEEKTKKESKCEIYKTKKENDFKKLRKFLTSLDTVRLWMIDDLIQYCYSPMIAVALVCNSFSLDHVLKCVNCPELNVQLFDEGTENLKANETRMKLASARVFLDCFDDIMPMNESVVARNKKPIS